LKHLERRVWGWMDNTLSVPRAEFNGHAICPWIRKYRDRIQVKEVEKGIKQPIEQAVQLLEPLGMMAICLAFPRKPPLGSINRVVEGVLNNPVHDDIEILINNHRLRGTIRGVYTGFKECDLVIIQSKTKLKWARLASKQAGYYK
jgi:hypothetical protein